MQIISSRSMSKLLRRERANYLHQLYDAIYEIVCIEDNDKERAIEEEEDEVKKNEMESCACNHWII